MNIDINKVSKAFFIGIGGVSMSSVAYVMKTHGCNVIGSDMISGKTTDDLSAFGIKVFIGHNADNITSDIDLVIYSSDIPADNCELLRAKELNIPCIVRAEAIGLIMKEYKIPIGVSGTHGKSTTTSMLSEIFSHCNADPTVLSGAELCSTNSAYRLGSKDYFIFEACEYKESFLSFYPKVAVILNVEEDHLDYYSGIDAIISAFSKFAEICGENGTVIVNADCKNALKAVENYKGNTVTFAVKSSADFTADNIAFDGGKPEFDVYKNGVFYKHIKLSVFGEHNVYNALASIAAAYISGLDIDDTAEALKQFGGAKRRFEFLKNYNGAQIYTDYGHHPSEVAATLSGAKMIKNKKIICVFQPHTFTRVYKFQSDFVKALSIADKVILAPVYAKRDKNVNGVDSSTLAAQIDGAVLTDSLSGVAEYIKKNASDDEIYILMGAGDINKVSEML